MDDRARDVHRRRIPEERRGSTAIISRLVDVEEGNTKYAMYAVQDRARKYRRTRTQSKARGLGRRRASPRRERPDQLATAASPHPCAGDVPSAVG